MKTAYVVGLIAGLAIPAARAWDYEGHRLVNQLALASLPTNFPGFVREPQNAERVAYLAGEPDRWRNQRAELSLRQYQEPDHYIDLEQLTKYGLKPEALPIFRYDFVGELAVIRKTHPEKFSAEEGGADEAHTRALVGLLPWAIVENYGKLKSAISCLKAFQEEGGTADELANAQGNALYIMGVMGHYVGDASQPLHTTIHHHGWKGENPNNYSTRSQIHSQVDSYFAHSVEKTFKELQEKSRPARLVRIGDRPARPEEMFQAVMNFIIEQQKFVDPLYKLDKEGKLFDEGNAGAEGRAFLEAQLLKSGQLLGDIWYSAWEQAPSDTYLKAQLAKRKH
ncbi:MAG TPA: hypothetical protein VLT36_25510 [Candidatus Dormibacteraeota bacterium]|nr:hypothetical protein [Candidatus Dormibacteraeota bacterium]